jgi:hypothetical protein
MPILRLRQIQHDWLSEHKLTHWAIICNYDQWKEPPSGLALAGVKYAPAANTKFGEPLVRP